MPTTTHPEDLWNQATQTKIWRHDLASLSHGQKKKTGGKGREFFDAKTHKLKWKI